MGTTRFKGENDSERLSFSEISDSDMIQLRHKPGTEEDSDKGISKASLCICPFGVSDTSASTAVKSAVLTDSNPDFNLVSGREVVVCFTTANTASSPSLNFAGSGSIPIYYPNGSTVGSWPANTWMHLKYFYATIGNTSIQRWILLSPLPVDTVALNNMQSVTSNAVAQRLGYYNSDGERPTSPIQAEILSTFNKTSLYTPFSGHTQSAEEGYYIGFKHNTEGEFLFFTRHSVMFCIIENGVIRSRKFLMYT